MFVKTYIIIFKILTSYVVWETSSKWFISSLEIGVTGETTKYISTETEVKNSVVRKSRGKSWCEFSQLQGNNTNTSYATGVGLRRGNIVGMYLLLCLQLEQEFQKYFVKRKMFYHVMKKEFAEISKKKIS